jgi:thiol-disulfide isomerase/thioredoxin
MVSLLVLAAGLASAATAGVVAPTHPHTGHVDPGAGVELLGNPAPDWTFDRWVRGGPLTLPGLRGKVVLVRWWTDGCHYCRTTLPVLEGLRREHPRDLVVIGVYHPKPPRAVTDTFVLGVARKLGFGGPIALDRDWRTLRRYWLDADPTRGWTSVSFLIDREGVIRWVHPGGEYHPSKSPGHARCDAQYRELRAALDSALEEPIAGSGGRAQP